VLLLGKDSPAKNQSQDKKYDEKEEQELCDSCGCAGYTTKA
jgi:hypothetical protein